MALLQYTKNRKIHGSIQRSSVSKRVLLTTACIQKPYDYIASNIHNDDSPRLKYERHISYGLRFLQTNVPGIEILEYPSWSEYVRILQVGWDIVGFSFYTNEIPTIRKMVSAARKVGISELWGGNYGILTPEAASLFDRVAQGYSEFQVAEWLDVQLEQIVHPPLIVPLKLGKDLGLISLGILFTLRGCNRGCTFCQTPAFCGHKLYPLPIDNLAEIIQTYQRLGVGALLILDECFGSITDHAEQVVSLLDKSALPWLPMTRTDILTSRLPDWGSQGLAGALLGIESLRNMHLRHIKKGSNVDLTRMLIKRLQAEDRLVIGFYMIGFEDDTRETLEVDLQELAALKLDLIQVCILTPFHQTPLWKHLSQYGIDDRDLSKFDGKHLVWAHPNFKAEELERILQDFYRKAFPAGREVETIRRFGRQLIHRVGIGAGLSFLAGSFLRINSVNPKL
jgi:hypothetical protein